ncbi:unnamed protein product, partial [Rotaria sp. Silwood2]
YFKHEELNFVTQHEIDNTSMLILSGTNTTTSDTPMKSYSDASSGSTLGGKLRRKKTTIR